MGSNRLSSTAIADNVYGWAAKALRTKRVTRAPDAVLAETPRGTAPRLREVVIPMLWVAAVLPGRVPTRIVRRCLELALRLPPPFAPAAVADEILLARLLASFDIEARPLLPAPAAPHPRISAEPLWRYLAICSAIAHLKVMPGRWQALRLDATELARGVTVMLMAGEPLTAALLLHWLRHPCVGAVAQEWRLRFVKTASEYLQLLADQIPDTWLGFELAVLQDPPARW